MKKVKIADGKTGEAEAFFPEFAWCALRPLAAWRAIEPYDSVIDSQFESSATISCRAVRARSTSSGRNDMAPTTACPPPP